MSSRIGAVIPSAGQGVRLKKPEGKPFVLLGGKPILAHTLETFEASSLVHEVVLVVRAEDVSRARELVQQYRFQKVQEVCPGGERRKDSVLKGIQAFTQPPDVVVIHDGARPFLSLSLLEQSIQEGRVQEAVVVGLPCHDTIKQVNDRGRVEGTPERRLLWSVQTPQVFHHSLLVKAHLEAEKEGFTGTDDASLVERLGVGVKIIRGSPLNIKITTEEDLALGEALLNISHENSKRC